MHRFIITSWMTKMSMLDDSNVYAAPRPPPPAPSAEADVGHRCGKKAENLWPQREHTRDMWLCTVCAPGASARDSRAVSVRDPFALQSIVGAAKAMPRAQPFVSPPRPVPPGTPNAPPLPARDVCCPEAAGYPKLESSKNAPTEGLARRLCSCS